VAISFNCQSLSWPLAAIIVTLVIDILYIRLLVLRPLWCNTSLIELSTLCIRCRCSTSLFDGLLSCFWFCCLEATTSVSPCGNLCYVATRYILCAVISCHKCMHCI